MKLYEIIALGNFQKTLIQEAGSTNTKLVLAFRNHNSKNISKLQTDKYTKPLADKELDCALVGVHKEVLTKDGNYLFDKEGIKTLEAYKTELLETDISSEEFSFYSISYHQLSDKEKSVFTKINEETKEFISYNIDIETYKALSNFITDLPEYENTI